MKILFTGGGTGGHVFPLVALIREIRRETPERIQFTYVGPKHDLGELLLSGENVEIKRIAAGKIRRYWSPKSILLNIVAVLFRIPFSFFQAFFYILFSSPDLVVSKGGNGSLPVVWWSWLFMTPVIIHESDIAPGLANRLASKFASVVFVSFPRTEYFKPEKMALVGNPIRKRLLNGSEKEAKETFELTGEKPIVLVMGGSQGAQRLNDLILDVLPEFLDKYELIHQVGERNIESVKQEAKVALDYPEKEKYYHPYPFLQEAKLRDAYEIANLIVARAGSGTIFEIAALGKPSILIPLPEAAQNHQFKNAYYVQQNEAGIVLEEENLTSHFLLERINFLFSHPSVMEKLSKNTRKIARPEAGAIIAKYIVKYLTQ